MYNHQKSSDRAPRHHREGLPGCVLLPNFRSRVPGSFGASVTDPSGWSVLPRNRHEQLCSEQESSGLSFLQFSVSFEIRISSFLLLVNFYGEKIVGACPDFQMEILSVIVILAKSPVGGSWLDGYFRFLYKSLTYFGIETLSISICVLCDLPILALAQS